MLKHNGTLWSVKQLKLARLHITRYLCGKPLLVNDSLLGLKDGFPKAFLFLKPYIDSGCTQKIKFALTLLGISRTIKAKKTEVLPLNLKTITDPRTTKKEYIIPIGFIKRFVKDFKLFSSIRKAEVSDLFVSTKAGPNGPATLSSIITVLHLNYPQMQWIMDLASKEFRDFFCELYTWSWHNRDKIPKGDGFKSLPLTGRISVVHDPECKERLIAITDYVSQVVLKPFHDAIFSLLRRRLPQDRTFTQDPWIKCKAPTESFWSLDLTAATDRFPLNLQRRLLGIIFQDDKLANSWANLIANRLYLSPIVELGKPEKYLSYSVGQPMGAYSSWAAFTLSHHLVVQYCAMLVGKYPFQEYIILGDDIVIYNDIVAKEYIRVMARLGVDLSPAKSHVSKDTYEFAKRWIRRGVEVSGLPLNGLVENLSNPFIIYTFLFDFFVIKGNQYMFKGSILDMVCSLYRGKPFLGVRKVCTPKWVNSRLRTFSWGLKLSLGRLTYDSMRTILCRASVLNDYYVLPGPITVHDEMSRIIGNGLSSSVQSKTLKLSSYANEVEKYLSSLAEWDDFKKFPILHGIINHVRALDKISKDFDGGSLPLKEAINHMVFLDISSVVKSSRNKILDLLTAGDIARRGLKRLREEQEVWYGSASATSTWDSAPGLGLNIRFSNADLINKLNKYLKPKPKPVVNAYSSLTAYAMAWQTFYEPDKPTQKDEGNDSAKDDN
jgi:hypothetical protein